MLPQDEGGLVAYVAALLNWHRRHAFCAACGTPSDVTEGGLARLCPRCATTHHPRTDPVVIMLVADGDRLLLGRAPSWPPRRFSALAGFVEPGESLEEAVVREVAEESGVTAGPPRYIASQPWPFPSSLMLGFIAPWVAGDPHRRRTRSRTCAGSAGPRWPPRPPTTSTAGAAATTRRTRTRPRSCCRRASPSRGA